MESINQGGIETSYILIKYEVLYNCRCLCCILV